MNAKQRTTVLLDTRLLKEAKHEAIESNLSLSELISRSIKIYIHDYDLHQAIDNNENTGEEYIEKLAGSLTNKVKPSLRNLNVDEAIELAKSKKAHEEYSS